MIRKTWALILGSLFCMCSTVSAAELSREEAKKILTATGSKNVIIAGVVNGIGFVPNVMDRNGEPILARFEASGPNVATVFAYEERNGKPGNGRSILFYDKELGWFYHEIDTNGRRVRLWTASGYKELKPDTTTP